MAGAPGGGPPAEDRPGPGQPSGQPPAGEQPAAPAYDDESQPATRGEVRTLRRWLAVAGVWAVAATAIAVIALIDESGEESSSDAEATEVASELSDLQRSLDRRLERLDSQIEGLPSQNDVSRLEGRLREVEDAAGAEDNRIRDVSSKLDDLEREVQELRRAQREAGQNTTTTP